MDNDFIPTYEWRMSYHLSWVVRKPPQGLIFLMLYKANLQDRAVLAMWSENSAYHQSHLPRFLESFKDIGKIVHVTSGVQPQFTKLQEYSKLPSSAITKSTTTHAHDAADVW